MERDPEDSDRLRIKSYGKAFVRNVFMYPDMHAILNAGLIHNPIPLDPSNNEDAEKLRALHQYGTLKKIYPELEDDLTRKKDPIPRSAIESYVSIRPFPF